MLKIPQLNHFFVRQDKPWIYYNIDQCKLKLFRNRIINKFYYKNLFRLMKKTNASSTVQTPQKSSIILKSEIQHLFQSDLNEISLNQSNQDFSINQTKAKKQVLLYWKIQELQQACQQLVQDNKKLENKIQGLLQQASNKNQMSINVEEDNDITKQLEEIQQIIADYKDNLSRFQSQIDLQNHKKYEQTKKLTQKLDKLLDEKRQLKIILQNQDKQIQQKDNQLSHLKKLLRQKDTKISQLLQSNNHRKQSNAERQLISLVEKLVIELQQQRQYKSLIQKKLLTKQKQLMIKQQQINSKNQKIRQLQMSTVKESKNKQDWLSHNLAQLQNHKNSHTSGDKLKCFSLGQVFSKSDFIFSADKIFLLVNKIVQHYYQKFQKSQYTELTPENLLIFDYHSQTMNMFSIRQFNTFQSFLRDKGSNKNRLLNNMGNILLNLLDKATIQGIKFTQHHQTKQKLKNIINMALMSIKNGQRIDQFQVLTQLFNIINQFIEDDEQMN